MFEVQRCTRRCAETDRKLEAGEVLFSVLEVEGADIVRKDYSCDAWKGPPEDAFAWWKSKIPEPNGKQTKLAPNEVLLNLLDQLSEQPHNVDMRYVLTLLLIRRRLLRLENLANDSTETLHVYCPRRDESYEVPVVTPSDTRIEEIQQHLGELLFAA